MAHSNCPIDIVTDRSISDAHQDIETASENPHGDASPNTCRLNCTESPCRPKRRISGRPRYFHGDESCNIETTRDLRVVIRAKSVTDQQDAFEWQSQSSAAVNGLNERLSFFEAMNNNFLPGRLMSIIDHHTKD